MGEGVPVGGGDHFSDAGVVVGDVGVAVFGYEVVLSLEEFFEGFVEGCEFLAVQRERVAV